MRLIHIGEKPKQPKLAPSLAEEPLEAWRRRFEAFRIRRERLLKRRLRLQLLLSKRL